MGIGIVGGYWCWITLGMAQFFKCGSEGGGTFSAIVNHSHFCFGCIGHDMFDESRENRDGTVV